MLEESIPENKTYQKNVFSFYNNVGIHDHDLSPTFSI